jgi:hypothetical protein
MNIMTTFNYVYKAQQKIEAIDTKRSMHSYLLLQKNSSRK